MKDLQPMKRAMRAALLVLLLSVVGMTKMYAYSFSAVCETGQTLYYNITDTENHYVELTCPGDPGWNGWDGYNKPNGNLILPSSVYDADDNQYYVTEIGYCALYNCTDITGSLVIPNTVISIDNYAFCNCEGLTSLVIGNSVTSVGKASFSGCIGLVSLSFGNSVSSIGDFAFYVCNGLVSVSIPNSVTSIGKSAFDGCEGLTSLTIGNSIASIGDDAFSRCNDLNAVYYTGDIHQWCNIQFGTYRSNPLYYGHNLYVNNELVTDLVIPETITEIKSNAFRGATCLTSLTIPNSVTIIGDCAFDECSGLTGSLTIPNSVTTIENAAFYYCSGLSSLTIGNSVTSIGASAFYYCSGLTGSLTIPNSVTSIGGSAFYGCSSLTSLTMGSSVTSLGYFVFSECSSLNAVYYMGDIQQWCNIEFSYTDSNPLQVAHNLFIDGELVTDLVIPETVTEIKPYAFSGATCLATLTIPNSIVSIGSYAFNRCTGLISIIIGNSVTSIDSYAFYGCNNILCITSFAETPPSFSGANSFYDVSKTIPFCVPCGFEDAYASLSWGGFDNFYGMCGGTVSVDANLEEGMVTGGGTFEAGQTCTVTAIPMEGYAFAKWTLNGVIISNRPEYTFYVSGDMALTAHFVPDDNIVFADSIVKSICVSNWDANGDGELSYSEAASVLSLGACFKYNSEITSFDELQYFIGLKSIDGSAFYNCSGLSSVAFPNSVTSIGNWSFYGCSALSSITIGNSIISIGENAFKNCSGLTGSLIIPNSVTSLGTAAFQDCSGLTSLSIGNSVTSIEGFVFYGCSGLTGTLTIPNSVTSIGAHAFRGCSGLTGPLVIPDAVTSIGYCAFKDCSGFTSLTIGNSVILIGNYAFQHCGGFMGSLNIPNSVTSIGEWAFSGCSGISSLTIGNSVTTIGDCAFLSCGGINVITVFAETPPTIESNYVFGSLSRLTPVFVPCDAVEAYQNANRWNVFTNIRGLCSGEVAVTINPIEGGTVTGAGYYNGGDPCVLTATPNPGYSFGNWTEDGIVISRDPVLSFYAYPTAFVANFYSDSPIVFADANVKAICVANWDTNGDGELSYAEAAVVTSLGEVFSENSLILSFDEFQYFIGLSYIDSYAFYGCSGLTSIEIPSSVTYVGADAFSYCSGLTSITVWADNPPTLEAIWSGDEWEEWEDECKERVVKDAAYFDGVDKSISVYVPCGSLEAYQNAEGWNEFTNIQEVCSQNQTVQLVEGTNWFSTYLDISLDDLKAALVAAMPNNSASITIKSKTQNVKYQNGRWTGSLTTFDVTQLYKIIVSEACEISLEGVPVDPSTLTVTIAPGANWIAFPYSESMSVTDFFGSFPVNNDVLKSKSQNTRYSNGRWAGQLNTLIPGQGYIYNSSATGNRTFTFPTSAK